MRLRLAATSRRDSFFESRFFIWGNEPKVILKYQIGNQIDLLNLFDTLVLHLNLSYS